MKIGVIGTGHVGETLAKGLAGLGHEVRIGSRSGSKLADFSAATGIAEGTFSAVAGWADTLVVALAGWAAVAVVQELAPLLAGKVVLDTTNPISGPPVDGVLPYFTAANESLLQRLQAAAPQARFVKCFNSVGAGLMVNPSLPGGRPAMFICGDHADAKALAGELATALGWNVEDAGPAANGHAVEALCQIWCYPGLAKGDWAHAFAMFRP